MQFLQDARHVMFDDILRKEHALADFPVGESLAEEFQNLWLARGQF